MPLTFSRHPTTGRLLLSMTSRNRGEAPGRAAESLAVYPQIRGKSLILTRDARTMLHGTKRTFSFMEEKKHVRRHPVRVVLQPLCQNRGSPHATHAVAQTRRCPLHRRVC